MTHHWLDSTHVAFGVVTLGVNNQRWKAELSTFNGRAPDEGRVALDLGALDSVAGRISFLPTDRLALQVSVARLRDAKTEFPVRSDPANRFTASAVYHVPLGLRGIWATTLAYGANHSRDIVSGAVLETTTAAALLETSATVSDRHTVFGRAEVGAMPAHHLHAHEYSRSVFAIGKLQVGYVRHCSATKGLVPGIGGTVSLGLLPPALAPRYAGRVAPGFGMFLSLRPARHAM